MGFTFAACSSDSVPANANQAALDYARIVQASYEDSVDGATKLSQAIGAFVAVPSAANLEAARTAWKSAREPYLQTEAFRFYDGPIDNPTDGPEGLLNAWPMDENYVDYVDGVPMAGIINDTSKLITAAALAEMNEGGGEKNIATGYHPIEFLLWGQDQSDNGPGARPFTDYLATGGTASNQDRRRTYLTTAAGLLVEHLTQVRDAWGSGTSTYRSEFEAAEPKVQLQRILTGLIVLSGFETGGERLQAALDSGDQEDEHSCFSDNTHRDMVQDVRGVQNVYLGRYVRTNGSEVKGVGIYDVVAASDPALADQLRDQIASSLMLAEALQPPFDREIATTNTAGRARVTALITSLRKQEMLLQQVFQLFNLTIPMPE